MFKISFTIILSLLFTLHALARESWKLLPRQSFYTNESTAEMLLHIPDEISGEEFSLSLQLNGSEILTADTACFKKFFLVLSALPGIHVNPVALLL